MSRTDRCGGIVPLVRFLVEERGHLLINGPEKFGFVGMQSSYVCSLTRVITDDDWQALNERFVIPDNIGFFKGLIQDNENGCDIVGTEWVGLGEHRRHVDVYEAEMRAEGRGGFPLADDDAATPAVDDREVVPAGEQDRPLWRHLVPMVHFLVEERGHLIIMEPRKWGFAGMSGRYECGLTRRITDDDWRALEARFVIPRNIGFLAGMIRDSTSGCDIIGYDWIVGAGGREHVDSYEAKMRAEGRGGCPSIGGSNGHGSDDASVNPPPPPRPVVADEADGPGSTPLRPLVEGDADGPGLPPPDPMLPVRMPRVPSLDRRLFAKAVDSVVYFFLFGFVMVGLGEIWGHDFEDPDALPSVGLVLAWEGVFLLAAFAYETVFVAKFGATVGKLVTGMRVVHEDDAVLPTWRSAAIRAGVPVVGVLFLIVGLFVVWGSVILDPGYRRQGWHDKLAHTVVVARR